LIVFLRPLIKELKLESIQTKKQEELFHINFGASRFVYNNILDRLNKLYNTYPNQYKLNITLINTFLKQLKQEHPWLEEIESTSLQQSSRDLYKSYQNFFKNPKTNFPKFHSKKKYQIKFQTNNSQLSSSK
jgi:putative transposase